MSEHITTDEPGDRTTLTAYRGGEGDSEAWYTTDRQHAAYFGEVEEVELCGIAARLDAEQHPRLAGVDGYEADEIAQEILSETGADMLIMEGWEGAGLTILVSDPDYVVE